MSKCLLGNYNLSASENILYQLVFEIPENCEFTTSSTNHVHCITITLKPGETEPSEIYVSNRLEFTMTNRLIVIEFEQECNENALTKRPVIRVED
jgi:hypothetical protein